MRYGLIGSILFHIIILGFVIFNFTSRGKEDAPPPVPVAEQLPKPLQFVLHIIHRRNDSRRRLRLSGSGAIPTLSQFHNAKATRRRQHPCRVGEPRGRSVLMRR